MNKLMLIIFPLCVGFGIGHIVGYNRGSTKICPEDLSVALKGCETVATDINNELSECEHKLAGAAEILDQCKQILRGMLLPEGKTMRKP